MLGKLIETTSGISKVAKLAILNEELAKNPNFLDPLQKVRLFLLTIYSQHVSRLSLNIFIGSGEKKHLQ